MEENSKTVFAENFHEHQDFAARNAELENLVADRNMKIKNLEVQLGICKKIITQHHQCSNGHDMEQADFTCKLQQALEARDELKFTVTQLQKELEEFRNKPKATLVYEIRVLRAMVADSEDQLKQCQEKLIDSQKALILAEAALTEEQKNTKLMRRICESEKDKVMRELQTVQDALMNLQEEYDRKKEEIEMKEDEMEGFKTRRDAQFETYENLPKHERGLREREQREVHQIQNVLRTHTPQKNEQLPKAGRGRKTQDENLALAPDEVVQSVLHEIPIESDPDAESGSKLRLRRKRLAILLRAFRKRFC